MDQLQNAETLNTIAAEAFSALWDARQIPPFSSRPEGLTIDGAYRVTPLVRQMCEAHGSKVIGHKIGFTNRTIWTQYGVYAPIWGYVFDHTAHDLADVETLTLAPFSACLSPTPRY
jgi:2-keto-4-pentenoate hydratase